MSGAANNVMTPERFDALAALLRLRFGPAQVAARLVLVDGLRLADAAREAGCTAQSAANTLAACRRGLALARVAAACQ